MGIWKTLEFDKCSNEILMFKDRNMISAHEYLENLKIYAQVYTGFFHRKDFFRENINLKTPMLIYRYSKLMCESCILEDLKEIELFQEEIGKEKILLLPAYPDDRMGVIELSNVLVKHNFVNIPLDSLVIPSDEGNILQRYFAVIDKDYNLTMVFIPRRGEENLTRTYFLEVKKEINREY